MQRYLVTIGCWRRWRRGMRWLSAALGQGVAAVGLIVALSLAIAGPLLCVFHCHVWLPAVSASNRVAHHHHSHGAHSLLGEPAGPAPVAAGVGAHVPDDSTPSECFWRPAPAPSDSPVPPPPSPVHEMLPVLVGALIVVLLWAHRPVAPPGDPPWVLLCPPLHPPTPSSS